MKEFLHQLKNRVLEGYLVTREDVASLLSISIEKEEELQELLEAANEIREKFCGNFFNLCTILNAKSGRCSENCRYCAQSAHFKTNAEIYPLVSKEVALEAAKEVEEEGAHRFSLVTSGRGLQGEEKELDRLQEIYQYLQKNTKLDLCASHGICSKEALQKLKDAGVKTYHHNLESSRRFYPSICTSHSFEDRVNTVKYAHEVGLQVCSGGIFGLGETEEDRMDMAFDLRELGVHSVPINILTPIPGTPLEKNEAIDPRELLKDIAIYRFILPKVAIRYAGGRVKLGEYAKLGLRGGVNSALTGNFLTTTGNTIESDKQMIKELGYEY
ncbi:biotin synthase BioB [Fusobacterium necrophorum subsp. funduliforme]|uniref:Biotin synthase n=5 Tax=Fusobacterium necrophorum TaxID=859 RepID=A0AAN4ASV1_9FUSO|nr:biotin synthase BioB [Fusobacterium necrophorum]EHO18411.1 biotin synthase [Fusobacterium necrophorum subsp. funduliforme 1_1_36S]AVQ21916.1 biotin synthase BioB [Fusobacterium necrophorum subsp. funduliforme]AYV93401.1 biotin synthase BioB [Fusobacterium necrophorum subsp. funduliforme]AYV95526.1 biotin synthase BioB [Fusobacterium necrophorum subsp. funduliforme]AYZ74380.1 biotin synthase BioB [Fusobacterium necrophorum]